MPEGMRDRENADLPEFLAFGQLPKPTKEFFGQLRPEEVEALKKFSRLSPEEQEQLFQAIKLAQSFVTAGKAAKWLIISVAGTFVGFMLLADNIQKALAWFQTGGPK
jgi:hypothetical protein